MTAGSTVDKVIKAGKEWGLFAVLAGYLIYSILNDLKPVLVRIDSKLEAHTIQTHGLEDAMKTLIAISRVQCVISSKTDAQRRECSLQ